MVWIQPNRNNFFFFIIASLFCFHLFCSWLPCTGCLVDTLTWWIAIAIISVSCCGIWQKYKWKSHALEGWNDWISCILEACFQFSIESDFASTFIVLSQTYTCFDQSLKTLTALTKPISLLWALHQLRSVEILQSSQIPHHVCPCSCSPWQLWQWPQKPSKSLFTWIIRTIKDLCKYSLEPFLLQN